MNAEDGREFLVRAEMTLGMFCVSGVTVCVLALATLQPGTVDNTLLLTRLEKDNHPVTVQIATAQNKVGFLGQGAKLGWGRLPVKLLLIFCGWRMERGDHLDKQISHNPFIHSFL